MAIINLARQMLAENEAMSLGQAVKQSVHAHISSGFHPTNLVGKAFGFGSFAHTFARRSKYLGEAAYEPGGIKNPYAKEKIKANKNSGSSPPPPKSARPSGSSVGAYEAEQAAKSGKADVVIIKTLGRVDTNTQNSVHYLQEIAEGTAGQLKQALKDSALEEEKTSEALNARQKEEALLKKNGGDGPSGASLAGASSGFLGMGKGLIGNLGMGMEMGAGSALGGMLGPLLLRVIPPVAIAALVGKGVWDGLNKWQETGDAGEAIYAALDGATLGIVSALGNLFGAALDKLWKNNKDDILDMMGFATGSMTPAMKARAAAAKEAAAKAAAAKPPAGTKPAVKPAKGGILDWMAFGAGVHPPASIAPPAKGPAGKAATVAPAYTPGGNAGLGGQATSMGGIEGRLLNMIASAEAPRGVLPGYDGVFGNRDYRDLTGGKTLTQMTISEVLALQPRLVRGGEGGALGRYQMVTDTFRGLVSEMGLKGNELFSPELQDSMAVRLLNRRGLAKFKAGKMSADEFQNNLSLEWAGLPNMSGISSYQGVGSNKATIGGGSVMSAITGSGDSSADYATITKAQASAAGASGLDVVGMTAATQAMARQQATVSGDTQFEMANAPVDGPSSGPNFNVMGASGGNGDVTASSGLSGSSTEGIDDIISKVLVAMGAVTQT